MSYTSFHYLLLIGGTVILYYLVPRKARWYVLLAANLFFYAQSGWEGLTILLLTALATWWCAARVGRAGDTIFELKRQRKQEGTDTSEAIRIGQLKKKRWLKAGLASVLLVLITVKYTNFLLRSILRFTVRDIGDGSFLSLVIPLGISFYSFMMIAYLVDVYKGKIKAQDNFLRYFLFISFFPTVVQGPIARYKQMGGQLFEGHSYKPEALKEGCILILWGFAKKLVVAENLGVLVGRVFGHYAEYRGLLFLFAAAAYSIQMYADFSGCMDIADGTARLFGIRISKNFLQPYFSETMPEFWRRWHASLGSWFRDYVFFPLSVSKISQRLNRNARKWFKESAGRIISAAFPIMTVWILTGIWHGAESKYIVWGMFHGILILLSTIFDPWFAAKRESLKLDPKHAVYRAFRICRTFFLCCIGRYFFRAGSVKVAFIMLFRTFSDFGRPWLTLDVFRRYGMSGRIWLVLFLFFLVWLTVSILSEKGRDVAADYAALPMIVRWILFYVLLMLVLVAGRYGPGYDISSFIYENF